MILKVFLQVLSYSLVITVVRRVVNRIKEPTEDLANTELEEKTINWKKISTVYSMSAIGFTVILILALSMPSNLDGTPKTIVISVFVLIILFCFLLSFLYAQIYIKFGTDKIYWKKMSGKKMDIRYEDITSFKIDGNGNLKLYQGKKCVLNFATAEYKTFIIETLKKHKVGVRNEQ